MLKQISKTSGIYNYTNFSLNHNLWIIFEIYNYKGDNGNN